MAPRRDCTAEERGLRGEDPKKKQRSKDRHSVVPAGFAFCRRAVQPAPRLRSNLAGPQAQRDGMPDWLCQDRQMRNFQHRQVGPNFHVFSIFSKTSPALRRTDGRLSNLCIMCKRHANKKISRPLTCMQTCIHAYRDYGDQFLRAVNARTSDDHR